MTTSSRAGADETARPWAEGVGAEAQAAAEALFGEGNQLLDQNLFAPALARYREALEHWDHPAIRYNAAVALINLERPIEAYEHLRAALRYGDAALEPEVARQARSYERLLEGQVARLTVDCTQPGVDVTLDGRALLRCPGQREILVAPGEHELVATRRGFLTRRLSLVFGGGDARRVRVELMTLEQATVERRRWDRWKPWAIAGTGAALGLAGMAFELRSHAWFESYDNAVAVLCADEPCDELPGVVTDARDRARRHNRTGVGFLVAGGGALVAGAVLVVLNRPHAERVGYDGPPSLAPVVGRAELGMAATWRF